jgi:hypothetical protein
VTDHAAERFRQRVGGTLDAKAEIVGRVVAAVAAGRCSDELRSGPTHPSTGARGSVYVTDLKDRSVVYVCRRDGGELLVVTLWEQEGGVVPPRVPRRYTDALERHERELARRRGRRPPGP